MKIVVQRVNSAKLTIDGAEHCSINRGILALVGIKTDDNESVFEWIGNKLVNLRIFNDAEGKMNLSVSDIEGEIMLVSNFTLYGDARKGFRPSYTDAMLPELAKSYYDNFVKFMQTKYPKVKIVSGIFGAMMDIELINNGPVTVIIEK